MLNVWIILLSVQGVLALLCISRGIRESVFSLVNHELFIKIAVPLLRLSLAYMFIRASLPKIGSPSGFAELVAQYQFLPPLTVNFFSLWLPVFELLAGVGLVITKWHREFSGIMFFMMIMFIIALAQTLIRDLGVTCGCFDIEGAMDKNDAWSSLIRDLALSGPIVWMWLKGKNKYIWDFKN